MSRRIHPKLTEIGQLAGLGLPLPKLLPQLGEALAVWLEADQVLFHVPGSKGTDEQLFFTGVQLSDTVLRHWSSYWAKDGCPHEVSGVPSGQVWIQNSAHIDAGTSARSSCFALMGIGAWLRMAICSEGVLLGFLLLGRRAGRMAFGEAEEARSKALMPLVAQAFHPTSKACSDEECEVQEGLMVMNHHGLECHACATAIELRQMIVRPMGVGEVSALISWRQGLAELIQRLVSTYHGELMQSTVGWLHENAWGRFEVHASPLDPAPGQKPLVAMRIGRYQPVTVSMTRSLSAFSLSPRQRDIALLVALGESQAAIGDRLGLRPSTVAGLVKDVFHLIGVSSRQELRCSLLRQRQFKLIPKRPFSF